MVIRRQNDDLSRARLAALAAEARVNPTVVFAKSEDSDENGIGPPPRGRVARLLDRWCPKRWLLLPVTVAGAVVVAVCLWWQRPVAERLPDLPVTAVARPAAERVVVNVVGEVPSPGLVTVTSGARVADVVQAAGGLKPGADLHGLNLARKVGDGEQIAVGVPPSAQGGGAAVEQKLDLNSASKEELDRLPGVGPVTAQRIIDWRTKHGPFASVEQLREIEGIGQSRLTRLAELVRT